MIPRGPNATSESSQGSRSGVRPQGHRLTWALICIVTLLVGIGAGAIVAGSAEAQGTESSAATTSGTDTGVATTTSATGPSTTAPPSTTTASTAATTLSSKQWLGIVLLITVGMLLAGVVIAVVRAKAAPEAGGDASSVVRAWIAISLIMGLLVFCAAVFAIDDSSLRSALFGGLIANVGAAVAYYFSSKAADQARADILQATTTLAGGVTRPTRFVSYAPPSGKVGQLYVYQFQADGQPPPQYELAVGQLPAGVTLDPAGKLSGTPTAAETQTFAVLAKNVAGQWAGDLITVEIDA